MIVRDAWDSNGAFMLVIWDCCIGHIRFYCLDGDASGEPPFLIVPVFPFECTCAPVPMFLYSHSTASHLRKIEPPPGWIQTYVEAGRWQLTTATTGVHHQTSIMKCGCGGGHPCWNTHGTQR